MLTGRGDASRAHPRTCVMAALRNLLMSARTKVHVADKPLRSALADASSTAAADVSTPAAQQRPACGVGLALQSNSRPKLSRDESSLHALLGIPTTRAELGLGPIPTGMPPSLMHSGVLS
jgi:hypothetical protein